MPSVVLNRLRQSLAAFFFFAFNRAALFLGSCPSPGSWESSWLSVLGLATLLLSFPVTSASLELEEEELEELAPFIVLAIELSLIHI